MMVMAMVMVMTVMMVGNSHSDDQNKSNPGGDQVMCPTIAATWENVKKVQISFSFELI